ncbi:hypothetical protein BDQ17DRAFT_1546441 [Cyathus striatus]|nr:hypothetical protein BDQ17DRAFT_1546441 [Cyathus striatus]
MIPPNFATLSRIPEQCDYDSIRKRVNAVDPNEGRCLVENCSDSIEYCHVLPRKLMQRDRLLDSLEWNWFMRKGDLNLDTRFNIFPASESVGKMFNNYKWILVPDETIVEKIFRAVLFRSEIRSDPFMSFEGEQFEYRLLPIADMDDVTFTRKNDTATTQQPGTFTAHRFPFETLPKLVSHIHPKFVVAAAGYFLYGVAGDRAIAAYKKYEILQVIGEIYLLWSSGTSRRYDDDPTFCPDIASVIGDIYDEEGTPRTGKGRVLKRVTPVVPTPDPSWESASTSESNSSEELESESFYAGSVNVTEKGRAKPYGRKRSKKKIEKQCWFTEDNTKMWDTDALSQWAKDVDPDHAVSSEVTSDSSKEEGELVCV